MSTEKSLATGSAAGESRGIFLVDPEKVSTDQASHCINENTVDAVSKQLSTRFYPLERFLIGVLRGNPENLTIQYGLEHCIAVSRNKAAQLVPGDLELPCVCVPDGLDLSNYLLRTVLSEPLDTFSGGRFADVAIFLSRVRDAFHTMHVSLDGTPIGARSWEDISGWAVKHSQELGSRAGWFLDQEGVRVIYGVVCGLRPWHMDEHGTVVPVSSDGVDTRPWDAFTCATGKSWRETLMRRDQKKGRAAEVFTSDILSVRFIVGNSNPNPYATTQEETFFRVRRPGSPLEQVLFLSLLTSFKSHGMSTTVTAPKVTKNVQRQVRRGYAPESYTPSPKHSMRIASCISRVYGSWDAASRLLGFDGLDEMMAPYILFDEQSCSYVVLESRRDGFAPELQRSYLLHGKGAQTGVQVPEKDTVARSFVADAQLRAAAARFFADLHECVQDDALFSDNESVPGAVLHTFIGNRTSIPDTGDWSSACLGIPERVLLYVSKEMRALGGRGLIKGPRPCSSRDSSASGEEDDADMESMSSSHGTESAHGDRDAEIELDASMRKVLRTYNCKFEDFEGSVENDPSESLQALIGNVQLVLTDPPYGTRKSRKRKHSDHDSELCEDEVVCAVGLISRLLRPGGHCVLFCSVSQFDVWRQEFEKVDEILVDAMPLFLIKSPKAYRQMPFRKSTTLANMAELAVHCCKRGAGLSALKMVSYQPFNAVPSRFAGWCNVIDNVPNTARGESLKHDEAAGGGSLRSEQKCLPLMVELVSRFSLPDDIVVDLFSGTYTTAVACLKPANGLYRQFFGCEPDSVCHAAAQRRLQYEYSSEVLRGTFGIGRENPVWHSAEQICRSRETNSPQWKAPNGFPGFCRMPQHLLYYLATALGEPELAKLQDIPVDKWPVQLVGKLNTADFDAVLAADAMFNKVMVGISTIPGGGQGLFTLCGRSKGDVIGWYNGSIVYRSIGSRSGTYADGVSGVTSDRFSRFAIAVDASEIQVNGHNVRSIFLVPPEFCAFSKINDPRYSTGKDRASKPIMARERAVNVKFDVPVPATSLAMLTNPFFISITATRDIVPGEELFVHYGTEYQYIDE